MNRLFITILIVALIAVGIVFSLNSSQSLSEEHSATTTPSIDETFRVATISPRIDNGASALGVMVVPLEILEDSRCPTDVTCIWAGTVRLRATVVSDSGQGDGVFVLGEPIQMGGEVITLTAVQPNPISTEAISSDEYVFTFTIERK